MTQIHLVVADLVAMVSDSESRTTRLSSDGLVAMTASCYKLFIVHDS